MNFEAMFNPTGERIAAEKGSLVSSLGGVACQLVNGSYPHLQEVFPDLDMDKARAEAKKMLERCFSSKDKKKRIEGYLLCDEEFKLSKTKFPVTRTIENVDSDGGIYFVDIYYLSDFFDFLRLEMMHALANNVPIVKCGSCNKFFLADNPTMEYCDDEACRQYGAKKRSKETKQADALLLLYDKVYQATYYKHKRCIDEKQKNELHIKLKQLMEYRMKYKKSVISAEEFQSFLESI